MKLKHVVVVGVFLLGIALGLLIHYIPGHPCLHHVEVQEGTFFGKPVGYPYHFFKEGVKVRFMDIVFHILKTQYTGPPTITDLPREAEVEVVFPDGWKTKLNIIYGGYAPTGLTRIYIIEHGDMKAGILVIEGEETILLAKTPKQHETRKQKLR